MTKERPTTRPKAPEDLKPGESAYGGRRAHNRAMEDWGDDMSHWHRDAKAKNIACYENCPDCRDDIRYDRGGIESLAQTPRGRIWLRSEVARRLKV